MLFAKSYKNILLTLIALSLCGCATFYKNPKPAAHYLTWSKRQQQLHKIKKWYLHGDLGVKYNNQDTIAHVYWQQVNNSYTITLFSPFDIGSVTIVGNPKRVTLWESATKKVTAKTPEQLMYNQLGWSLPINNLKYWIRGLPVPNSSAIKKFDSYNHLILLQQQNWQIKYANFQSINNIDLPTRILIKGPQIQVKIIIKRWGI